jgi:hypothetical protein
MGPVAVARGGSGLCRVNDIVMEFGNARFQDVVDRYTAGENVPVAQVQRA